MQRRQSKQMFYCKKSAPRTSANSMLNTLCTQCGGTKGRQHVPGLCALSFCLVVCRCHVLFHSISALHVIENRIPPFLHSCIPYTVPGSSDISVLLEPELRTCPYPYSISVFCIRILYSVFYIMDRMRPRACAGGICMGLRKTCSPGEPALRSACMLQRAVHWKGGRYKGPHP